MLVGAGSPVDQLSLGGDEWLVHLAVVRRADELRRQELSSIHGVQWITVPEHDEEVDEDGS